MKKHFNKEQLWLHWKSLLALPVIVVLAICGVLAIYLSGRPSRTLLLPFTKDSIQQVDLGVNEDLSNAKWYRVPLPMGEKLINIFKGSVEEPSQTPYDRCTPLPNQYGYSLRITDNKGKKYTLFFNVTFCQVYIPEDWAHDSFYVFPKEKIPQLKKLLKSVLSKQEGETRDFRENETALE